MLFGPRVGIYTSNHAMNAQERAAGACYAKKVKIGNNVWIGAGVPCKVIREITEEDKTGFLI